MEVLTAFRRLFAGLVIVLLDIRINTFDIIPDAIGFFLIVWALDKLSQQSGHFGKAKVMALVLVVFSIISLFQSPKFELGDLLSSPKDMGLLIFSLVNGIAQLVMAYFIFEGIQELVAPLNPTLASAAENRKWFYVGFHYLLLLILPWGLNLDTQIIAPFIVFFGLIVFVLEILFISVVHRAGKEFYLRQEKI